MQWKKQLPFFKSPKNMQHTIWIFESTPTLHPRNKNPKMNSYRSLCVFCSFAAFPAVIQVMQIEITSPPGGEIFVLRPHPKRTKTLRDVLNWIIYLYLLSLEYNQNMRGVEDALKQNDNRPFHPGPGKLKFYIVNPDAPTFMIMYIVIQLIF